ncbi:hypothetical protein K505DRAFT_371460 [Melanomma pulvis-pyrius CBS 109.77]|uniref:Zn(2)-C6 fungal-type domain-containing protein n=1 Tax=Melanomma pulvis-pyrius CBS 109.77 TaxID=1314802 RepID=A0A6A6XQZ4_9PLEO|nr:hypothetical protein K505DRAFT_371460 [Melanomma pulvis-pyrius CBS 109.77]
MNPIADLTNVIACLPCAKAKAKCDKQLPICSRCLYKRIKCEPRQPRRVPDARVSQTHQSTSQVQSRIPFPPSQSSYPHPNQHDTIAENQSFQVQLETTAVHISPSDDLRWPQSLLSTLNACPGDLPMDITGTSQQQFHPSGLKDTTVFTVEDSAMDYGFAFDDAIAATPHHLLQAEPGSFAQFQDAEPDQIQNIVVEEDWPCFQCNPPSDRQIDPGIGSDYLKKLEDSLNDQSVWTGPKFSNEFSNQEAGECVKAIPAGLRDKLMVISQGFLSRARDVHRTGREDALCNGYKSSSATNITGFFILPPTTILESFLQRYASRVEPYIPFFSAGSVDISTLFAINEEKPIILLLLLMIAQGSIGSSLPESRYLANGLMETCRICIFDVLEKNVQLAANPIMLRSALLYLSGAAWSGNKWHMDLATAHFRMYTSMIRHSRMLDSRKSSLENMSPSTEGETAWNVWKSEEGLNRLAYSWITFDQELNIFHDRQPDFDVNELNAPTPDSEELWNAESAHIWHRMLLKDRMGNHLRNSFHRDTCRSPARLFSLFMSNRISDDGTILSLAELRLLLHPLQAMIYHINKSVFYLFASGGQKVLRGLVAQQEDVQYYLSQWYAISSRCSSNLTPNGYVNMVMFHLIGLNALTYFPDIERVARGDISPEKFRESYWTGKRCSEEAPQIWCHCGQIIRYFRLMPASNRPHWWNAAIYRVALCMWATRVSNKAGGLRAASSSSRLEPIAIDRLQYNDPSIIRYLRHGDGLPNLSQSDGSSVSLGPDIAIVCHCIEVLKEKGPRSQLDDGIINKLSVLIERWK